MNINDWAEVYKITLGYLKRLIPKRKDNIYVQKIVIPKNKTLPCKDKLLSDSYLVSGVAYGPYRKTAKSIANDILERESKPIKKPGGPTKPIAGLGKQITM